MAADRLMLPETGSVLGIDVGWSLKSASSGICRLDWDGQSIGWTLQHFSGDPDIRRATISAVSDGRRLLAVGLDGPFRGDLAVIDRYRQAERVLSQRAIASRVSQPGSSRSPVGRLLNHHTNAFAGLLIADGLTARASHRHAVHELALFEAFPTSFLGLMLEDVEKGERQQRSDRYFIALVANGGLERLLTHHLPGRRLAGDLANVRNHDERAALVCAITALGVARADYLTVGDADGWIMLPPRAFIASWAQPIVADWNHG
ncbi:hypothetical protein KD146_02020 [Devosia sp. BSSL-BM10]|uniref:DUF429 domain-containing protein n=1 Tax=Devosia litorisediminis TaxID=2829817 RepID=A0A942IC93_9HYPH|nr:hypothetical protein [Devosia litorisediminis]MBS3847464.1 hypothetical protein [Devosia litorisediminis]